jgi:hypothetical protein
MAQLRKQSNHYTENYNSVILGLLAYTQQPNSTHIFFCDATAQKVASLLRFLHHANARTHAHKHPVRLLCTRDQLAAETVTYTTHTRDEHLRTQRDRALDPSNQATVNVRL